MPDFPRSTFRTPATPQSTFTRRTVLIGGLGAAAAITSGLGAADPAAADTGVPFASSAPINTAIRARPVLDPDSAAIAAAMGHGAKFVNVVDYGVPVVHARSKTPGWKIVPTRSYQGGGDWGPNQLDGYAVPINMNWYATPVSADGVLVVIDGDRLFEFYGIDLSGNVPRCAWATTASLTRDRISPGPTGANISRLAGVIRLREWRAGVINHALVFSTDMARPSAWRTPATKTDGRNLSGARVTIREGTRIQLNPSINVDAQPWRPYTKIVARALQRYGAYCVDNGGGRVGIIAECPQSGSINNDALAGVGITKDYAGLELDWTRIRVLRNENGR